MDLSKFKVEQKTVVWVTTSFVGFHRWLGAPEETKYLRDFHRHVFVVKAAVQVTHDNRDVEFHNFQKVVERFIFNKFADQKFELSCEQIADLLGAHLLAEGFIPSFMQVSEDDENGAIVAYNYKPIPQ